MATTRDFPVKIGDRWFATDLSLFERGPLKSISQVFDTAREPGEQSLGNEGIWKRSQFDFVHGAGQSTFDDDEENDRRRFDFSLGIDPWERNQLTLLPLQTKELSAQGDGDHAEMVVANDGLYMVSSGTPGVTQRRIVSGWGAVTGTPNITADFSLASIGNYAFLASSGQTLRRTNNTVWSTLGLLEPDHLVAAADRLIGMEGNTLYEIDNVGEVFGKAADITVAATVSTDLFTLVGHGLSNGTKIRFSSFSTVTGLSGGTTYYVVTATADTFQVSLTSGGAAVTLGGTDGDCEYYPWSPMFEHWSPDYVFKGGTYSPAGVYIFGDDGTRSTVQLLVPIDATTEFAPPYPVMELPDGELIRDIKFYGGVVILATSLGFRLAQVGSNGTLIYGPLREVGDVRCLEVQKQYAWFGYSAAPGDYLGISTVTGLGRMGLDRFTDPLVPSYASDVMIPSGSGTTRCCAFFQGEMYFGVDNGSALDVYGNHATLPVASASFAPGTITYGIPEQKAITSLEVRHSALGAGQEVIGQVFLDNATAVALGTSDTDGDTVSRFVPSPSQEAEYIYPVINITSGNLPLTLYRWSLRTLPMVRRSERIRLGVMLVENVSDLGLEQVRMDPQEEFEYLLGLSNNRTLTTLVMGDRTDTVVVDAVMIDQNQGEDMVMDWDDQGFINARWIVEFLTNSDS